MNDFIKFTAADDILAFIPHTLGEVPKEEKRNSDWCVTFRGSPAITPYVSAAGAWTPTRHPAGLPL